MLGAKRWVARGLDYYRHQGLSGVAYGAARKLLWGPRQYYRRRKWSQMRDAFHPEFPLVDAPRGVRMYLNPDDSGISTELCAAGVHEPILTDLLSEHICPGATVVDVGANIGYFALQESRLVGDHGKIIAFEPFPATFQVLQRNIEFNEASNVYARQLAIGDTNGKASFYGFEEANWNSMVTCGRKYSREIEVEVATLDSLLSEESSIDALRMDVEGFEGHVIRGAEQVIRKHRPLIILELHSALMEYDDVKNLLHTLDDHGYEIRVAFPRMREEFIALPPSRRSIRDLDAPSFAELLADKRLRSKQDNFSVVIAPA